MAAAPCTSSEFLGLLAKSGLLDQARLATLGDLPEEPIQCADALVSQGIISKFQAKLLLNGRYKGFKLGAYFIREQIGQGGMGAVYQAEHETLRRKVALKVLMLPKEGNAALSIERFLREARSAAALDHPNIVRLHDVGKQADTHFLVMEFVEGQTLDQIVSRTGPLSPSRAVEYIAQAAAGLQHASEKGFIHRDIKPANLMLARDGTVKILDMGLARPTDNSNEQLTEVMDKGAIVGTADYISPEQAMDGDLDVRSDIYSLGATFFALVTGQPPFAGNTTQKLIQHQLKDAPSVATIDKTFPAGLSLVVAKMLAKKPEHRYQSPGEVITALADWLPQQASGRMIAAISGTDMAHSAAMQTTLSELASGTKRIGTKTRLGAANGVARSRSWFWPGLAAGVLLLAGGTTAAIGLGQREPEPSPETVVPSVAASPKKAPPAKPAATPPKPAQVAVVPAIASQPVLYQLDLIGLKPFTMTGRSKPSNGISNTKQWEVVAQIGDGTMPTGWNPGTFHPDTVAEYLVQDLEGRPALGFHRTAGPNNVLLATPNIVSATGKIQVSFKYLAANNCGIMLRFQQQAPSLKAAFDLGPTPYAKSGAWRSFSQDFDLNGASGGRIELHTRGSGAEPIWIRNFTVHQAGDAAERPSRDVPLYQQNFKATKLARMSIEGAEKSGSHREIDGVALPATIHINQHRANISSEYCIADLDGVRALGLQLVHGDTGVQIHSTCGDAITLAKPGEALRLRISYRHDGSGSGRVAVQQAKAPFTNFQAVALEPTNGSWKTVELIFVRPNDVERYELILNAGTKTAAKERSDGMIYIQSIEVHYAEAK